MKTDATDRLAKLLKIEKPDIGYETEQALQLAANEIEWLRKRISELERETATAIRALKDK